MIEIKFKVFDNGFSRICYSKSVSFETEEGVTYRVNDTEYPPARLYTGLKDKNGVEIYQGDILKTVDGIMKVYFDDGCFWVESEDHGAPLYVYSDEDDNCSEIIGNIYENPEMIS